MAVRIRNAALLLVLFAGLLSNPPDLSSCGPFIPTAAFAFWRIPDDPASFARGRLGIVQPGFPRFYLIIAYRYLAGIGLNEEERAALLGPEPAYQSPWSAEESAGVAQWQKARAHVATDEAPAKITTFRTLSGDGYYLNYLNCGEDAFVNAARTLEERVRQLGPQNPAINDWIAAQDEVFANCSGGPSIPSPLEGSASRLQRADRTYQIAAAHFYAGDFEDAEQMFRSIGDDRESPWRVVAPYLAVRSLVRRGTLSVTGQGFDRQALAAAEKQLQAILNDATRKPIHPAATRLLDYVGARLRPAEKMRSLSEVLVHPHAQATIQQASIDYRFLYDRFENGDFGGRQAMPAGDDLTAWLISLQSRDNDNAKKALAEWHDKKTVPWLVAALSVASGDDPAAGELIAAAQKIGANSPGYATVAFHAVRLMEESKRTDEARATLDNLLASGAPEMPMSATNLFRAERMKAAANWDEFLKYSVRMSAGSAVAFTQYTGDAGRDMEEANQQQAKPRPGFDVDAAKILNEQTAIHLLSDAARRDSLPAAVRREIAMAAWVRAVVLTDEKAARALAPTVQNLAPELNPAMQAYVEAPDSRARAFAATFLMLRNPGMRPYVQIGFGRETPLNKIDNFRDNWWCSFTPGPSGSIEGYYRNASIIGKPLIELYRNSAPAVPFLAPEDRERARREWADLAKLPSAPDYLAGQAIDWAKSHPGDPRVPEALHLCVRASRYGCATEKSPFSKQAFELLHKQYPDSEWAHKTKFWY